MGCLFIYMMIVLGARCHFSIGSTNIDTHAKAFDCILLYLICWNELGSSLKKRHLFSLSPTLIICVACGISVPGNLKTKLHEAWSALLQLWNESWPEIETVWDRDLTRWCRDLPTFLTSFSVNLWLLCTAPLRFVKYKLDDLRSCAYYAISFIPSLVAS